MWVDVEEADDRVLEATHAPFSRYPYDGLRDSGGTRSGGIRSGKGGNNERSTVKTGFLLGTRGLVYHGL